ncbi:MAG: hypothetical protein OEV53_10790 [Nitrospira sp.]|nr:hypothetical protein [Nitrospira sp.]
MTWGSGNPAGQEVFVDEDDRHRLSDLPEEGVRLFGGHSLQLSQHALPHDPQAIPRRLWRVLSGPHLRQLRATIFQDDAGSRVYLELPLLAIFAFGGIYAASVFGMSEGEIVTRCSHFRP